MGVVIACCCILVATGFLVASRRVLIRRRRQRKRGFGRGKPFPAELLSVHHLQMRQSNVRHSSCNRVESGCTVLVAPAFSQCEHIDQEHAKGTGLLRRSLDPAQLTLSAVSAFWASSTTMSRFMCHTSSNLRLSCRIAWNVSKETLRGRFYTRETEWLL